MTTPATKEDFKKLATKTELKTVERNLRGEILRVEERVENLEEGQKDIKANQEEMKAALTKLQNTLDGFVGTVDDLRTDNEVGTHHLREIDKRVAKLESSSHAA